ncbi:MAG: valine--tRNA ligase [Verrucomicrobiota bacterium]
MSELAKAYEPSQVEDKIYQRWLERKDFHGDVKSAKASYSIVIPPPNVTGMLTMGHVLNNTIQDILARKARLDGKEVMWLPGTDHAGIATQTVVEKKIKKEHKKSRHDLGREAFLKEVWAWKEKHGGIIIQQLKKLGCSCDWERERFTMDEGYSRAVVETFVELFKRGYIYRGKRLVNWCPVSLTAISDEEVIPKPQKGFLYYMKYEIVEEPGTFLEIATTRPETLMGDTGVAVHPQDERYQKYIGKHCWRPFPKEKIPIVADEAIDPKFGTGVLKVTPAHDKMDFEIGQRHGLSAIDIFTPAAKVNCPSVPELHELDRFDARTKSVEMLRERNLLIKEEPYENNVGFSERADVPIEPRLSEQWFLKYPKTQDALRVVRERLIRFFPDRWEKVYQHWLDNIQDWCISRQLWWGHRIPVWWREKEMKCQVDSPGKGWTQDEDVLDTWCSSWLWAYATMDAATLKKFYPTSVLVTGPDIIFLWVARMIIASLEFKPGKTEKDEDNIPFRDVYFTGLIRDKQGRKMSKSLGNSPDPLDLIFKYGADGLRFGLMRIAPQGADIRFDEKQIEEGRNFCNKLWNSCRFRQMQGKIDASIDPMRHELTPFCHHILKKLDELIERVNRGFENYEFNAVAADIYSFVWDDFCSRFIEAAKADFTEEKNATHAGTLATFDFVLSRILRMLHPYAPFITEELWLKLDFGKETIQFEPWPQPSNLKLDLEQAERAAKIYETADTGRRLKAEYHIPSNQKPTMKLHATTKLSASEQTALTKLINAEALILVDEKPPKTPLAFTPLGELFLPLEGLIDPEKEKQRLEKELEKATSTLERENKKLSNEAMCSKAPKEKVQEWHTLAEEAAKQIAKLKQQLENL